MYITNTAGCGSGGAWETYATSKSGWTISPNQYYFADVYAKYKSSTNEESACLKTTIAYVQPQLVAGDSHNCALLSNATVKCWGWNLSGQLGQGNTTNVGDGSGPAVSSISPINFGSGRVAVQLTAGSSHNCALLDDGSVKCWGYNLNGQLGIGNTTDQNSPTAVDLGSGHTALQIASGSANFENHTCALLDDGTVKCWGGNASGELGLGDTTERHAPTSAVNLGSGRTATQIAVGGDHTCALLDNAAVSCWGRNAFGELGVGDMSNRTTPVTVSLGSGFTATRLVTSYGMTCAWTSTGNAKCWGLNSAGQLGQGNSTNIGDGSGHPSVASTSAINFGSSLTTTQVGISGYHACARLNTGGVVCWGLNDDGQLGLESTTAINVPGSTVNLGSGRTATQIGVGGAHSCALLDNNSIKCWGYNYQGQLGQGNTDSIGNGVGVSVSASTAISF